MKTTIAAVTSAFAPGVTVLVVAVVVALTAATVSAACASAALTETQQQEVIQLAAERERVETEIASATEEYERYSGGLVKSLLAMRLELLRTTSALLQPASDRAGVWGEAPRSFDGGVTDAADS